MKKLLLGAGALLSFVSFAQLTTEILPYSNQNLVEAHHVATKTLPQFDIEEAIRMDIEEGQRDRAGRIHTVSYSMENSGTWTDLNDGGRLWELKIIAPGAMGVNLYFDQYDLPEGATLHMFNEDRSKFLGAFTSLNNKSHKKFATDYLVGNSVILEYYEPADVLGLGKLQLEGVNRLYVLGDDERADPCQVDVNCSEGDAWTDQRDATVRLLTKTGSNTGWCSGALVNNTNFDCANYVLTALHCGIGGGITQPQASDLNQYVVYWKHQKPNCGSGWGQTQSLVGVDMKGHSNDGGGTNGSDFFLFEMQDAIPDSYNAYYAGWDANTTASSSGVSIHHPSGDYKKISTYSSSLVSSAYSWGGPQSHWRVTWVATANGHGVTEGGSSGSPIFNSDKRIVGQLTGGSSYCNEVQPGGQNQPDYYGKMSYNWSSNPGANLKDFLAPGSSIKSLGGGRKPCQADIFENGSYEPNVSIYPNPSTGYIHVNLDQFEDVNLTISNELGQVVLQKKLVSSVDIFDLSGMEDGVYFLTFIKEGKKSVKKIVKTK